MNLACRICCTAVWIQKGKEDVEHMRCFIEHLDCRAALLDTFLFQLFKYHQIFRKWGKEGRKEVGTYGGYQMLRNLNLQTKYVYNLIARISAISQLNNYLPYNQTCCPLPNDSGQLII